MDKVKKRNLFVIILLCCLILIYLIILVLPKKNKNSFKKEENYNESISENKKEIEFNDAEKKIIDSIYKKLDVYKYFDEANLKSFEIIRLSRIGYYMSERNIYYIFVEYNLTCKDGTYNCDNLCLNKNSAIEFQIPFSFWIKLDINTYDYIEKIDGISIPVNSDWVATDYKIE